MIIISNYFIEKTIDCDSSAIFLLKHMPGLDQIKHENEHVNYMLSSME